MIVLAWVLLVAAPAAALATGLWLVRTEPDRFVVLGGPGGDLSTPRRVALAISLLAGFVAAVVLGTGRGLVLIPAELVLFGLGLYVPVVRHNRRLTRTRAALPAPDLPPADPAGDRVASLLGALAGAMIGLGATGLIMGPGAAGHPDFYLGLLAAGAVLAVAVVVRWRRTRRLRP